MFPEAFVREAASLLGGDLDDFLEALREPPALALRINSLRPGADEASGPFISGQVPWAEDGRYLAAGARPGASTAHELGAFYLQEASAMIPAAVLDARPGERILDLCAAPGGKSGQIAASMKGDGLLVSNEPVPGRAAVLRENLERLGVVNAVAVCALPDHLAEKWPCYFDAVLVDAPCSGEGMFRRNPAAQEEWRPSSPAGCAARQAAILDAAARLARPGGRLVYSTCTFNRTENEGSVMSFLDRHPEFSPSDFTVEGVGTSDGGMLRAWPHRIRGDGHFAARLVKDADAAFPGTSVRKASSRRGREEKRPDEELRRLEEICRIPDVLCGGRFVRYADHIHLLPEGTPDLEGIRTVKPGLALMQAGRSHVRPMPALARACAVGTRRPWLASAFRTVSVDDPCIRRLREGVRPELPDEAPGWVLLTAGGFPAGFVKVIRR